MKAIALKQMLVLNSQDIEYCQIYCPSSSTEVIYPGIRYQKFLFVKVASFTKNQFDSAVAKCRQFLDRNVAINSIVVKENDGFTVWSALETTAKDCSQHLVAKDNLVANLTAAELETIVEKMRSVFGIEVKERWYNFKRYSRCFIGSDAVKWFRKNLNLTKSEAIKLGQILVKRQIIHHVCDEHDFKNEFLFYRFKDN